MTVVVLAEKIDPTADRVVMALRDRSASVFRCDTSDIPAGVRVSASLADQRWRGVLSSEGRQVRLEDIRAVWYRSTPRCRWPESLSPARRRQADAQVRFGLGRILADLPVRWINDPSREADAAAKPVQLRVASACGLRVPETLVSSVARDVAAFIATNPAVIKPLGSGVIVDDGTRYVGHTHLLDDGDRADLSGIEMGPHLIQRWVDKDHEVRLTVVGAQMFAAAIRAGSSAARIDWRSDLSALSYDVTQVPTPVRTGVLAYMAHFGLVHAAFDFVVGPDGGWTFLEVNAAGQFGWIELATGLPIASALADELVAHVEVVS